jgi:glycosyltransferase involved in cell wall biosynthesis
MRIIYLHQYFVPPETNGGTRSYEFARRLIAAGHDVCMITSAAMLPAPYQAYTRTTETRIAGIPVVVIPVSYRNEMSFGERMGAFLRFAALAAVETMRRPADVIYATSTPLTIALPAMAGRAWRRAPIVFEVRDLWPDLPIAFGALRNPLLRAAARLLEWCAYHAAAEVIALSPGMADGVARRGYPRERITVIPNSSDLELFDVPAARGQRIRARLPERMAACPLIVYAGAFGRANRVGYLVELAARMRAIAPEIGMLLVGSGAERDQVTQQAHELGLLGQTLWIWEPLPKLELPDLLAAATVATSVVAPIAAMRHNSANKVFDAFAAGRPVAINHEGWQADLLRESGAGIVLPPNDPDQAAALLADFVRDEARLARAGQAARALARDRFSRDLMASQLERVLCRAARPPLA